MAEFYDLCLRDTSENVRKLAEELGWTSTNCDFKTKFIEAENWGELKEKVRNEREKNDFLVFEGGDEKLNRKAAEETRIDILLHPEKGRKDSGINQVIAKEAAENNVAIGFDFRQLQAKDKIRSHILNHWRTNLMLCEKFDAPYIMTTGAREKNDLRAPKDLYSIIESLGYNGKDSVSKNTRKIIERSEKISREDYVRSGVEELGD